MQYVAKSKPEFQIDADFVKQLKGDEGDSVMSKSLKGNSFIWVQGWSKLPWVFPVGVNLVAMMLLLGGVSLRGFSSYGLAS